MVMGTMTVHSYDTLLWNFTGAAVCLGRASCSFLQYIVYFCSVYLLCVLVCFLVVNPYLWAMHEWFTSGAEKKLCQKPAHRRRNGHEASQINVKILFYYWVY